MNKFIMGIALGSTVGYFVSKMQEKGTFEEVCDSFNDFAAKAKKNFMNMVDHGTNELEYAKDRVEYKAREGKEMLDDMNE